MTVRKLFRFRLRTLLILVAVVAVALVVVPRLWWRYRVHCAIEATLDDRADFRWEFDPFGTNQKDPFTYLLSDSERVLDRLVATVGTDASQRRRVNALQTIRHLTARSSSFQVRQRLLPQLIAVATQDGTTPLTERELAETIAYWIPTTGVTVAQRRAILAHAKAVGHDERVYWIGVLDAIGGREETLRLLEYGVSHDPSQLWSVYNSGFRGTTWHGMLPHLKRWLEDPIIAKTALEFMALSHTTAGRQLLLDYVTDESHPPELRQLASEQLTQTVAGAEQLLSACDDEGLANRMARLLGSDSRTFLASTLAKEHNFNGDALWNELIDGLDPAHWWPSLGVTLSEEVEAQRDADRRQLAMQSLQCLRRLSGHSGLTTHDEWRAWHQSANPGIVEQRELLLWAQQEPGMLGHPAIRNRFIPYHLGFIPDDCLQLYLRMLRSNNSAMQVFACQTLLTYTDTDEAVDVAIDLIDQSPPGNMASQQPLAIYILRQRYAVNFFWDTDAWRAWAKKRREER